MSDRPTIAVLGGGAWGTALGTMAAHNGNIVRLYARDAVTVESINRNHRNDAYLPDIDLHPSLTASTDARRSPHRSGPHPLRHSSAGR